MGVPEQRADLRLTNPMSRIRYLDGIRALSIILVILGHIRQTLPGPQWMYSLNPLFQAHLGVSAFFVLSGYLISSLLMREEFQSGKVSLKNFYLRRTLRIFPAFYFYVFAIAMATAAGTVVADAKHFLIALTYTTNYSFVDGTPWELGHLWSLAVEEQFYLIWPGLFVVLSKKHRLFFAVGVIGLLPLVRTASYFFFPAIRDHITIMFHTRADMMMFGCATALIVDWPSFKKVFHTMCRFGLIWAVIVFLTVISPALNSTLKGAYLLPLGYTLEGLSISALLVWLSLHGESRWTKLLGNRLLAHLGVLSYSLYLWQQPFAHLAFPLNLLLIACAANVSYWVIERPMLRIKERFSARALSGAPQSLTKSKPAA